MQRLVRIALLLCSAIAWPAQAEQLYRCVGPAAAVSYQSRPCTGATRLDRVVDYWPDPVIPAAHAATRPRRASQPPGRLAAGPRQHRLVATAADRCRAAHAKRQAALERLGLRRTFAQLSRLDAQVRAVCGG